LGQYPDGQISNDDRHQAEKEGQEMTLKYVGNGAALPGVPARDLTEEETHLHGKRRLVKSGLYREIKAKKSTFEKPVTPDGEQDLCLE